MTGRVRGTVVTAQGTIDDGAVEFEGDRITAVGPYRGGATIELPDEVTILPGLVDVHCHGGGGGEFGHDRESALQAAAHHHRSGTTSVVGSLVSAPPDRLVDGMRTCAQLADEGVLAGVHTEGPFLSKARCGAQDPDALMPVDLELVDRLAAASNGQWRMMTFAPEISGSHDLLKSLSSMNVRPAIGHTDATAATISDAIDMARAATGSPPIITHLFNGMPSFHHRSPGPAAAALTAASAGDASVEVIADGVHLADETAAMVLTLAPARAMLISDAMSACGMPDGHYSLGRLSVVVSDGAARLTQNGALAGGVATLLDTVRRCVQRGNVPLMRAAAAASEIPARALGLTDVGALKPGFYADIVAVDRDLRPVGVWRRGDRLETSTP